MIRRRLLQGFNLHTILRLPTGIFSAGGAYCSSIESSRRADEVLNTSEVWAHDLPTGMHFTLKQRPLRLADLADFIEAYKADARSARKETEDGRFKRSAYEELIARDKVNLDITWLKAPALDDADSLGQRPGGGGGPPGRPRRV